MWTKSKLISIFMYLNIQIIWIWKILFVGWRKRGSKSQTSYSFLLLVINGWHCSPKVITLAKLHNSDKRRKKLSQDSKENYNFWNKFLEGTTYIFSLSYPATISVAVQSFFHFITVAISTTVQNKSKPFWRTKLHL